MKNFPQTVIKTAEYAAEFVYSKDGKIIINWRVYASIIHM